MVIAEGSGLKDPGFEIHTERCHLWLARGDVEVPCKSELSGWRPLARVRGHGLVVKAIYTWSGPCNSAAQYKQTNIFW